MYYVTEEGISTHERKYDLKRLLQWTANCTGYTQLSAITPDGDSHIIERIYVHKFNDPKLLRNPTTCQLGKYIACYYVKIWYIGVILECSNENQDVKVKFMTRKGLNLQWVNDAQSSQC